MGIPQARILERVAMLSSRGSSQLRDRTQVSCIAGRFFTIWAAREAWYPCLGYSKFLARNYGDFISDWDQKVIGVVSLRTSLGVFWFYQHPKNLALDLRSFWPCTEWHGFLVSQRSLSGSFIWGPERGWEFEMGYEPEISFPVIFIVLGALKFSRSWLHSASVL